MKKILFASLLLSSIASFGQYSRLVTINDCVGWCPTYYVGLNDSIVITIKIDSKLTTKNVRLCYSNAQGCQSALYPYYVEKLVIKPRMGWTGIGAKDKMDFVYECNIKVEDGNVIGGVRFVFSSALATSIEDEYLDSEDKENSKYFDLNGREIQTPDNYEGVLIGNKGVYGRYFTTTYPLF